MATIVTVPNDIWEVVIHGRQEGQEVLNVWHFLTATGNSSVEQQLLLALLQCWVALVPVFGSNYHFDKITGKLVSPTLGPIHELFPTAAQADDGTAVGDPGISFASCCLSIRTNRGGRTGRGRKYIGGIPEGATVGSSFVTENPYWVAIIAFIACVSQKFIRTGEPLNVGQLFELGVMSRKLGGAKPPFALAGFARATSITPTQLVKSTISRKVGKGS